MDKRVKSVIKQVVPPRVLHGASWLLHCRDRRIHSRDIVGRQLQVEGANHVTVDYDDAWLIALIRESDAFLDIGCNVGFFSLATCVLRPEAQVLAIDANPNCAVATAGNLIRNGFGPRSRAVASFVSDHEGEVTFNTVGLGAAGSALEGNAVTAESLSSAMQVDTQTLDTLCSISSFRPDLIKIDVEGAEREVLRGGSDTVRESQPRIMVEMHSGPSLPIVDNTSDVLTWCAEVGYEAWFLTEMVELIDPAQVAHRGRYHALLVPLGAGLPPRLRSIPQSAPLSMALAD